ncbi:hypothetical protein FRC07_013822, partial [Ceratobasidium sp. 392]
MVETEFDALLFEDEGEQRAAPTLETNLSHDEIAIKREDDDEVESESDDAIPDLGTRQHAIDCIEEWTLENLMEMSSDKPSWAFNINNRRRQGKPGASASKRRLLWPRKGYTTMKTI